MHKSRDTNYKLRLTYKLCTNVSKIVNTHWNTQSPTITDWHFSKTCFTSQQPNSTNPILSLNSPFPATDTSLSGSSDFDK